jgi:hypothetical protein
MIFFLLTVVLTITNCPVIIALAVSTLAATIAAMWVRRYIRNYQNNMPPH